MSYAIIGFGKIGHALAKAFSRKGIEVSVATTRGRGDGHAKRNAARRLPHHRCAAVGLDCGPTSGFDNAGAEKAFSSGARIQWNFICSIGCGDPASVFPCNPRLSFEQAGHDSILGMEKFL